MPEATGLGESAHDKAMLAKVDEASKNVVAAADGTPPPPATPAPTPPAGTPAAAPAAPVQRPDDVPEKFWDATKGEVNQAALLKSYRELEAAKSKPTEPPQDPPKEGDETPPADTPPAKLDWAAMSTEVHATGKVSDASLKALEAVGLSKDVVEQISAGQAALAELRDAKGFATAGGEQQYQALTSWAAANYSQAEQDSFNKAVVKGSVADMQTAITALKTRYEAANGKDPSLTHGQGGAGGAQAYASHAEVTAAIRDPKYRNDPAYRAQHEARLNITDYSTLPVN